MKREKCKINGLSYPSSDQISGRISTICRSMACTLLVRSACSIEEEQKWMGFFPEKTCAYCGKTATHLDHLHSLILERRPTGYGTEPANLVPCCRECNQPKGNMYWEDFMRSGNCHHIGDSQTDSPREAMEKRIEIIKRFQEEMPPKKAEFSEDTIRRWFELLDGFDEKLREVQNELLEMKKKIYNSSKT